jgi:hypothetical protein
MSVRRKQNKFSLNTSKCHFSQKYFISEHVLKPLEHVYANLIEVHESSKRFSKSFEEFKKLHSVLNDFKKPLDSLE